MKAINAFHGALDVVLRWFCIILFVLLVSLVVFQVIVRFSIGGNAWTEAMARIIFIWQGIIGAAYVIGENDDVAIDFFVQKFPAIVVKILQILAHAIVMGFAIWVMIWGGMILANSAFGLTVELLPFSQGQLYLVIPVSGTLICIYCILHMISTVITPITVTSEEDIDIDSLMEEGI